MPTRAAGAIAPSGRDRAVTAGASLLEIRGLDVEFRTSAGPVHAVNGVDLDVRAGEMVGLVGESGSGKSVTSRAVMGLLPRRTSDDPGQHPARWRRAGGAPRADLPTRPRRARRDDLPGPDDRPRSAVPAGEQVAEALRFHFGLSRDAARGRVRELFGQVGLGEPDKVIDAYPHQLSGGMRQRVMIAMALACEPELLIADEPTTALDVTIQAQILELLRDLVRERGMALLLITHDLGVVRELCERAVVLYAGRVAEDGAGRGPVRGTAPPVHGRARRVHPEHRRRDDAACRRSRARRPTR